jgi:hypothetical protein
LSSRIGGGEEVNVDVDVGAGFEKVKVDVDVGAGVEVLWAPTYEGKEWTLHMRPSLCKQEMAIACMWIASYVRLCYTYAC